MSTTQQDVIKKFMKSLDNTTLSGEAAMNEALRACSNSKYSDIHDFIKQMANDCRRVNNADVFLRNYCGIILDNEDTGAVTGWDMGGSKVKNAESIIPESGSLKSDFNENSFTKNGVTFQLSEMDTDKEYNNHYTPISVSSLSKDRKYIWRALYTWWAGGALDLIKSSYGDNFGFNSNSMVRNIHFGFVEQNGGSIAWVIPWGINGKTVDLDLTINMHYFKNLDTSDSNGSPTVNGAGYMDRTLAHELTHAAMATNINNYNSLPIFIKEGMADLTHGSDDYQKVNIQKLASDASSLKTALDVNVTSTSNGSSYSYAAGYMFLHYMAKQLEEPFTSGADYYRNNTTSTILSALGGNDSVINYANNVTIYGGNGNDFLSNQDSLSSGVKIFGGAGHDTLYNWGSNVTLSGGSDSDTLANDARGKNVVLTGDGGNDSVTNYASNVTIYGNNGNDFLSNQSTLSSGVKVYGGAGRDTLYNWGSNVTLSGGSGNDSIAADYRGKNVSISGGKGNDAIQNFANYATIYGGKGNDKISLSSQSRYDLVKYASGDGKDTVYGFNSDDTLRITKGSYKVSTKNNDVIVKVGKGSITLKDVAGKEISITNSKGKTTTKTYGFGSSNVAALLTEDNFSMEDDLSSIIQNDSAISTDKTEPQNFDTLSQKNNLITYANK